MTQMLFNRLQTTIQSTAHKYSWSIN